MKEHLNLETTSSSSVYKKIQKILRYDKYNLCPFCEYHKGCNKNKDYRHPNKSWKSFRNNQWKNN